MTHGHVIREELYDRLKMLLSEDENHLLVRDHYLPATALFGREGWDDPAMDVYNELDPRRQS